jgi:hypothetical protein
LPSAQKEAAYKREWYERNKAKAKASAKAWKKRNPDKMRAISRARHLRRKASGEYRAEHLRNRYGITPDDENALWESQDGRCAICQRELDRTDYRRTHLDHNHDTGAVRGFLCIACNQGIGRLGDDPKRIAAALVYLAKKDEVVYA